MKKPPKPPSASSTSTFRNKRLPAHSTAARRGFPGGPLLVSQDHSAVLWSRSSTSSSGTPRACNAAASIPCPSMSRLEKLPS